MHKYYQLNLFLVLIEKNSQLRLAETRPYKEPNRPKWGENEIFKGREWYYTEINKNYQLTLFLIVLRKFNQKSKFYLRLA